MDSVRTEKLEAGKPLFSPFIAPSYTPETELTLTAGGLYSFKLNPQKKDLPRSSIPFSVGYSTNNSLLATIRSNLNFDDNLLRLNGEMWLRNMPDHYWGVGYQKARRFERSDSTTQYHRFYWSIYQEALLKVHSNLYAGPLIDLNRTVASDLSQGVQQDATIQKQGRNHTNLGAGAVLAFDNRDQPQNAYRGQYLAFSATLYKRILADNGYYSILNLDYRGYLPVGRERRILAWQLRARQSFGDVPWPELPKVGSPYDLRAYYWGRYRDFIGLTGIVEYRHMFRRRTPNKKGNFHSPHGFVLWTGMGSVAPGWGALQYWLPNAGVGYRFEVQPRMNLRIDFGIGANASSFYVNFSEAF